MGLDHVSASLTDAAVSWNEWKLLIEHAVGVSRDALHMVAGAVLAMAWALLLRRPLSSWRPWLATLALQTLNEFSDLWLERWPDPAIQYGEGVKDLLLTMAMPSLLLVTTRLAPRLYARRPGRS